MSLFSLIFSFSDLFHIPFFCFFFSLARYFLFSLSLSFGLHILSNSSLFLFVFLFLSLSVILSFWQSPLVSFYSRCLSFSLIRSVFESHSLNVSPSCSCFYPIYLFIYFCFTSVLAFLTLYFTNPFVCVELFLFFSLYLSFSQHINFTLSFYPPLNFSLVIYIFLALFLISACLSWSLSKPLSLSLTVSSVCMFIFSTSSFFFPLSPF